MSWSIILEDIETAFKCLKEGKEISFPEKTASFIEWSRLLDDYSHSKELSRERTYWSAVNSELAEGRLVLDDKSGSKADGVTGFELDEELTDKLISRAGQAYNTQVSDLLVSALSIASNALTGQSAIAIIMKDNGREPIHREVNIDRTVGCFTSVYPVVSHYSGNTEDTIINTKDMLRTIPNHGMGYGLLYEAAMLERVNVVFNYIGEKDNRISCGSKVPPSKGLSISEGTCLLGNITIVCVVTEGRFWCSIAYNNCDEGFADKFADAYRNAIESVIQWCVDQNEKHATASDFSDFTLTNEELGELDDMF